MNVSSPSPTVAALFETILRDSPEAEAIVDGPLRLTFGDWWRRSGTAAAALSALGVRGGDVVCLVASPPR